MAKRSLQASFSGIQQAKRAFSVKGWTQENLAGEVSLKTRQPIWRFFAGKPVDRQIFMSVCGILDLDWREISDNPPADFPAFGEPLTPPSLGIDDLVRQVRSQHQDAIQNRCGILQPLDISHPVSLDNIYIDVNILEEISSQRQLEIADLQNLELLEFNRVGLGNIEQYQISGMRAVETYSKLRVLGKPGVGKTTFLQHLAIQCNRGEFAANQVPIFIALREFAEEAKQSDELSLFNYIKQILCMSGMTNSATLESLLTEGRVLLLLDGMDEVLSQDITGVLKEIRKFSDQYHRNHFVVSCRTASQKLRLRGFTDVEIAPFTQSQITAFAHKWFVAFTKTTTEVGRDQAVQFIEKLDLPENWQFRQMVVTPLFLHFACWVFQGQEKFPVKRPEFYKQGLDLLLVKWDEARGVERDEVYRGFFLPQKLKLLSQLAAVTFEQGQYFFEQRVIEQYIGDYLQNLTPTPIDPEELQLESEAMLSAIEAQHGLLVERARGIFSFSYLAFQEYFTARKIVASPNLGAFEQALDGLVRHITDPHWREVFLLTTAMLRSADALVQLMKQQIDALVAQDPYLQEFLAWASQTSQALPVRRNRAIARSFYLALAQAPHTAAQFALASTLDQEMFLDAALENLLLELEVDHSQDASYATACYEALSYISVMIVDASFYQSIQQLKAQLPSPPQTPDQLQQWWQKNYGVWVQEVKGAIANYRNIHHPWKFTQEQQEVLERYYDANQLLVDCLNSNCEVTETIRQDIEATLLLPPKELES